MVGSGLKYMPLIVTASGSSSGRLGLVGSAAKVVCWVARIFPGFLVLDIFFDLKFGWGVYRNSCGAGHEMVGMAPPPWLWLFLINIMAHLVLIINLMRVLFL